MPLPDERHSQSVANLIGRFEQQTKKQRTSSPGPRSSAVISHNTGDSAKEETREKKEWPPRPSTSGDSVLGRREWPPRLSTQNSGDSSSSSGQRWPPVQPPIQTSPFPELKKSPTSPLAKGSELASPPEVEKLPSPIVEIPKVIEVTPPSRKPTTVEPEPPKPVEPELVETPKTPPQSTVSPPSVKSGPSVVKSPSKTVKAAPTKPTTKATSKLPPSSYTKGVPHLANGNDRRASGSTQPPSRPTSRTALRSKTPTSTPARPSSSARRKPPTETPKHTPTPAKRPKTPATTSSYQTPSTPTKPPPVIPKTPNSRLYAPTAASLAKSTNSPQPPPPERKKTLSSGASLERLTKPTTSSLSKSRSAHSLASSPGPSKSSKPTQTRTGTLNATRKSLTTGKPGTKTETTVAPAKDPTNKDGDAHEESHENGNGVVEEPPIGETSDTGTREHESDREHESFDNGSLDASYTEEPSETTDGTSVHEHEVVHSSGEQEYVEEPEELASSHLPESHGHTSEPHPADEAISEPSHECNVTDVAEEPEEELIKDDIADIVGLLESTSFTSKHLLQGSDESTTTTGALTSSSEKERQRIGEIPDEE